MSIIPQVTYIIHGRKSRGEGEGVSPQFGVGSTNANCPSPRFCHVLKFQAPHCMHYNTVNSLLNTSGGKFNIFCRGHGKQHRSEFTKTRHFKWQIHIFGGEGTAHCTPTKPSGPPMHPPEFQPDLRHWPHMQFPIILPLQLCLCLVPFPRYYVIFQNLKRSRDS